MAKGGVRVGEAYRRPDFDKEIRRQAKNRGMEDPKTVAAAALMNVYDRLLPRWKGVALTAEAEALAEQSSQDKSTKPLPWANIKFSRGNNGKDPVNYQQFLQNGIPVMGEYLSMESQAHYRYHIDLGGGGGTTWTGTMQKLALPGLLFHHETPTKDYIGKKRLSRRYYHSFFFVIVF